MDTTLSENWHVSSTACIKNLRRRFLIASSRRMDEYLTPNHSRFPAIEEKDFLSETRVMADLDKVRSEFSRTEFRRDARSFPEEFFNCLLSTAASRSVIGQGMSCFRPAIVVNGDDVAPFQLFNKLLDGLLQKGLDHRERT